MPTTEYGVDQFFSNSSTSPKQVWDVNGVLGWSPHNMCLRSQEFNQATPWNPTTAVTVVADAIAAPDGTMTADRIVETAAASHHQILHANIGTLVGETYTVSVYAKAGERNWLSIEWANGTPSNWFDLTNGVVGTLADSGAITAVGNGWYRCSITRVSTGANWSPSIYLRTSNGQISTYAGDITKGLYLWGAQLNRGSTPQPYLPTTTAARYGLALDYDPVTHAAKGLLCEPAATNLQKGCMTPADVAIWVITGVTITSAGTAPTGGAAFAITEDTSGASHNIVPINGQGAGLTAGTTYTTSGYVKANGRTRCRIFSGAFNNLSVFFDLTSGTYDNVVGGTAPSARINPVGNGWYRFEITDQATGTQARPSLDLVQTGTTVSYTGNGTSGIYVWNILQAETGIVATSPIPTFAASVTRGFDGYTITSASINYGATAGSWWIEHYQIGGVGTNPRLIVYSSGAYTYTTETTVYGLNDGTILSKSGVPTATGNTQKVAYAFQSGDRAITATGLAAATDAGSTALLLAPGANITFGGSGGTTMRGYFRKLRYVPRRKTNTELVTETTP